MCPHRLRAFLRAYVPARLARQGRPVGRGGAPTLRRYIMPAAPKMSVRIQTPTTPATPMMPVATVCVR